MSALAPVKIADVRAELDRLARRREEMLSPATTDKIPEYCQRVAGLWSAEARAWADLPRASDFPLGTHHGVLLAMAAGHAAQFADARALSWLTSSGRDPALLDAM